MRDDIGEPSATYEKVQKDIYIYIYIYIYI